MMATDAAPAMPAHAPVAVTPVRPSGGEAAQSPVLPAAAVGAAGDARRARGFGGWRLRCFGLAGRQAVHIVLAVLLSLWTFNRALDGCSEIVELGPVRCLVGHAAQSSLLVHTVCKHARC